MSMKSFLIRIIPLIVTISLISVMFTLPFTGSSQAQPLPPSRFWGVVTLGGRSAPVGTKVEAYIRTSICGATATTTSGRYVIDVDNGSTSPGCGIDGDAVTFRVAGTVARATPFFRTGAGTSLTLTIDSLEFIQTPLRSLPSGQMFTVKVAVKRGVSSVATDDNSTVVTLSNGGDSSGDGTFNCKDGLSMAVARGVATFAECRFDRAGMYTIRATADRFLPATSRQILVTQLKVLFIQGISMQSTCPDSNDFVGAVSWLRHALQNYVPTLTDTDFLHYSYTSDTSVYTASPTCPNTDNPQYTKFDSCWSLDDVYTTGGTTRAVPSGGQATRLAVYLRSYLDANPSANIAIIAHSQGGVLAAYTIKMKLSAAYQMRVISITTLDSPLIGINSAFIGGLRSVAGCVNNDLRLDSSFDMAPTSRVITAINNTIKPTTKLYTVDASPGYYCFPSLCLPIPLVDDKHSNTWWSTAHISIQAQAHNDVWLGCFIQDGGNICADSSGDELAAEGIRLVRFTACAVLAGSDCARFADNFQPHDAQQP